MSTKDITSPAATTVTGRKIPAIEPRHQSGQYWQMRGQKFGEAFIVLPAGLIPQDLTDYPVEVWSKIQQTGLSQMPCVNMIEFFARRQTGRGPWRRGSRTPTARVVLAKLSIMDLPVQEVPSTKLTPDRKVDQTRIMA